MARWYPCPTTRSTTLHAPPTAQRLYNGFDGWDDKGGFDHWVKLRAATVMAMYTVTVESSFSALHRVRLADGTVEPLHGHDWAVRATFARTGLAPTGMVVDFEAAKKALDEIATSLQYRNLNMAPQLGSGNPTAEAVARFIFDRLRSGGLESVYRVCVTEAPGCEACYQEESSLEPNGQIDDDIHAS